MKHKTFARGAKLLLVLPVLALVAAGCAPQDLVTNSNKSGQQQTQTPPPQPQTKVDAMANSLSQGVSAEENLGGDAASVTSDQAILNGYSEVFNASDF